VSRRALEEALHRAIPLISHLNLTDFQRKSCGLSDTFPACSPLLAAPFDCAAHWMVRGIAGFEIGSSLQCRQHFAIVFSTMRTLLQ
jgi:hypothetical protein